MISTSKLYNNKIILFAEYHNMAARLKINNMIRQIKPDYLLSEEIGHFRYYTTEEKEKAIRLEKYSTGPLSLELAIELDIPIIGFDTWLNVDDKKTDKEKFQIREAAMLKILKEFEDKKICIICGSMHVRTNEDKYSKQFGPSILYNYCKEKNIKIIRISK